MVWFYVWRITLYFFCALGMAALLLVMSHVWDDHMWDDTMRQIQQRQVQQIQQQQQQASPR